MKQKTSKQDLMAYASQYYELLGRMLMFVEHCSLPLERKVFYEAALLKGYLNDQLMDDLMKEVDQATLELQDSIQKLQLEVEEDAGTLDDLAKQYALQAKAARHFRYDLAQAVILKTEQKLEGALQEENLSKIKTIQTKLKNAKIPKP